MIRRETRRVQRGSKEHMQSTKRITPTRPANRRPTGRRQARVVATPAPPPEPVHPAERRLRDAGGPQDRAVYACGCGCLFQAPVSTSVGCPLCGGAQSW